jgi:hypothetical protein
MRINVLVYYSCLDQLSEPRSYVRSALRYPNLCPHSPCQIQTEEHPMVYEVISQNWNLDSGGPNDVPKWLITEEVELMKALTCPDVVGGFITSGGAMNAVIGLRKNVKKLRFTKDNDVEKIDWLSTTESPSQFQTTAFFNFHHAFWRCTIAVAWNRYCGIALSTSLILPGRLALTDYSELYVCFLSSAPPPHHLHTPSMRGWTGGYLQIL